jgi:hypothetical protein
MIANRNTKLMVYQRPDILAADNFANVTFILESKNGKRQFIVHGK